MPTDLGDPIVFWPIGTFVERRNHENFNYFDKCEFFGRKKVGVFRRGERDFILFELVSQKESIYILGGKRLTAKT